MVRSLIFSISLIVLITFQNARAETWVKDSHYWINFHFTRYAFEKKQPISRVVVHAGLLREPNMLCKGRYFKTHAYWDDEVWIEMDLARDHFFSKKRFHSETSQCQDPTIGPIVQYWVYFPDGDIRITEPVLVKLDPVLKYQKLESPSDLWSAITQIDQDFNSITDAWETSGKVLYWTQLAPS